MAPLSGEINLAYTCSQDRQGQRSVCECVRLARHLYSKPVFFYVLLNRQVWPSSTAQSFFIFLYHHAVLFQHSLALLRIYSFRSCCVYTKPRTSSSSITCFEESFDSETTECLQLRNSRSSEAHGCSRSSARSLQRVAC